jgi:putative transposase
MSLAAVRFFQKLLRGGAEVPRMIGTDRLKRYAAAKREILPKAEHRQSRYLNNRAAVSHQPTRRRERQMLRFNSWLQPQGFLSAHSRIHSHFQLRRHLITTTEYSSSEVIPSGAEGRSAASPFMHNVAIKWAMTPKPFNSVIAPFPGMAPVGLW